MRTISAFAGGRAFSRPSPHADVGDDEPMPPGRALVVWVLAATVGWALTIGLVWAATSVAAG